VAKKPLRITAEEINIKEDKALLLSMKYKTEEGIIVNLLKEYEAADENIFFDELESHPNPPKTARNTKLKSVMQNYATNTILPKIN